MRGSRYYSSRDTVRFGWWWWRLVLLVVGTAVRFADDCGPGSGGWCDFIRRAERRAVGRTGVLTNERRWVRGGGGWE